MDAALDVLDIGGADTRRGLVTTAGVSLPLSLASLSKPLAARAEAADGGGLVDFDEPRRSDTAQFDQLV